MIKKLALTAFVIMVATVSIFAHPPSKVKIDFNKETEVLNIIIVHPVKDAVSHNIKAIIITVDGKEFKVITSEKQTDKQQHLEKVKIPNIKPGSEIKVSAKCNKAGAKSAKIVI